MIDSINAAVANWNKANISKAGKAVFINSVLMVTPIYYLFVYPISDTILIRLSQIARKFLQANNGNRSGIPLVSWNSITMSRPEGGSGYQKFAQGQTFFDG